MDPMFLESNEDVLWDMVYDPGRKTGTDQKNEKRWDRWDTSG